MPAARRLDFARIERAIFWQGVENKSDQVAVMVLLNTLPGRAPRWRMICWSKTERSWTAPARRPTTAISRRQAAVSSKSATSTARAARVIDASDLIVSPGFIDPHTHYDAQICWDPMVTCSSWHGVTTVIMGNCGVGLAPCRPVAKEHEIAAKNLEHVEAIPYDVLEGGLTWDWQTFPDYVQAAQRRGAGINLGFLAALSPFRHWVMGEDAMSRAATEEETAEIRRLLGDAIGAGALGFSLTVMPQHLGYKGQPLACRLASDDELRAYGGVLREAGRGVIEIALTRRPSTLSEREYQLIELLMDSSGRPVTWLNLRDSDDHPEACMKTLETAAPLIARGGRPQVAVRPLIIDFHLRNPFIFGMLECCKPLFAAPTVEDKKRIYSKPGFSRRVPRAVQARKSAKMVGQRQDQRGQQSAPGIDAVAQYRRGGAHSRSGPTGRVL